ncbi:helicase-related protein [Roseibium salinum]|nr:helicase-related protein [Roseibium salinum]
MRSLPVWARPLRKGRRSTGSVRSSKNRKKIDLAAVEERHRVLEQELSQRISLVHGRMSAADKDAAMADFKSGVTKILVATTVIEVGVDVPDATIIVIEHAERFGLAQLHQLRGRVGRGDKPSSCVLLYKGPLGKPPAHASTSCARPMTAS